MKSFVPRDKMSKRERKKLDAQNRTTWEFSPVTKIVKSKKVYDRKKQPRLFSYSLFRVKAPFIAPAPVLLSPSCSPCTVPAGT